MRQHALIGAILVAGASAHAAPMPLGEDELKSTVAGKTVKIDTPLGMPITVNYGANGIMTGTAGAALGLYLGSAKDRGRWHVRNGKLCQKWFKWLSGETACLTIQQDGDKIYWRSDDGKTGTAMIEPGPPVLDGATASGLGLPPPVTRAPSRHAEPPKGESEPQSPAPSRRETATTRTEAPAVRNEPARPRRPSTRPSRMPSPAAAEPVPALIEAPTEVLRPTRVAADPSAIRFAAASLVPMPPPRTASPEAAAPEAPDPFDTEHEPMRRAADLAAIGAMEHRWCHANAFAMGPALSSHRSDATVALPEPVSEPSLLTIAAEQVYEGELPLHDPSCVTEEPAIHTLAKLRAVEQ